MWKKCETWFIVGNRDYRPALGIRALICHIEYNRSHINSLTFDSLLSKLKGRWRLHNNLRFGKHLKIYCSSYDGFLTLHSYCIVQKSQKYCPAWFRLKKWCYHWCCFKSKCDETKEMFYVKSYASSNNHPNCYLI